MIADLTGKSVDFGPMYDLYSIDNRGNVYYRETSDPATLSQLSHIGRYMYCQNKQLSLSLCICHILLTMTDLPILLTRS